MTDDALGAAEEWSTPLADAEANLRRVKAVATVGPILDLERNKHAVEGGFWNDYDLVGVAAETIDRVALAMGVSTGLSYDHTVGVAVAEAARQRPDRDPAEHEAVSRRVVDALVSAEAHTHGYVESSPEGPVRRAWTWRLLYEQWAADESVYLRASEQAITVLLNALDVDPDSAQAAAEFQIRYLVERGMLSGAVGVATQARLRTAGYIERIRTIVSETRVDADAHDWSATVPALLDAALAHLGERLVAEGELLAAVAEARDTADTADTRVSANALIEILSDCRVRHLELQRHVMGARAELRRAQDLRFANPGGSTRVEIERDLLVPALGAPAAVVAGWSLALLNRLAAPDRCVLPELSVLVDEALCRRETAVDERDAFDTDDLDFMPDPDPWWAPYWDLAEAVLESMGASATLTQLCARARDAAEATDLDPAVAAAAICHLAHGLLAEPIDGPDGTVAVAGPARCADPAVDAAELVVARFARTHGPSRMLGALEVPA